MGAWSDEEGARYARGEIFARNLIGKATEQEEKLLQAASQEVDKRLNPKEAKGVLKFYQGFLAKVQKELRQPLVKKIAALDAKAVASEDLDSCLKRLCKEVVAIIGHFVKTNPWVNELASLLTAPVHVSEKDGTWYLHHLARVYEQHAKRRRVMKKVIDTPPFQLCNYTQYTTEIIAKSKGIYQRAVEDLAKEAQSTCENFTSVNSMFVSFTPTADCKKVKITCDTDSFVNALITLCLRRIPAPGMFQGLQSGVRLGQEKQDAINDRRTIDEEIRQIENAKDGILAVMKQSGHEIPKKDLESWAEQGMDE